MNASFCPEHKSPMVLFLDRVYGVEDQSFLLNLLEVGFLPDLRASASLDTVSDWCSVESHRNVSLFTFHRRTFHLSLFSPKCRLPPVTQEALVDWPLPDS